MGSERLRQPVRGKSAMFTDRSSIAVLLHGGIHGTQGKTGLALIRYRPEQIAVAIDQESVGASFRDLTGIPLDVPIVGSMAEAMAYQPDWLAIGIAPSGGQLPPEWLADVATGISAGISIANGLHSRMADLPEAAQLQPGQVIWDMRQEPKGLKVGSGAARQLKAKRILAVGTDMSVGKMSACLELHRSAQNAGYKSQFLGTGQAGIMIAGAGIPLDAVRVDFAAGAIEQLVMNAGDAFDLLWVEGQGSILHPGSTATLPLIRGSQPTDLILVHRAGQTHVRNHPQVAIPPLPQVIHLYEAIAHAAGAFAPAKVVGIALNTGHLDPAAADRAIAQTATETGLPCSDIVRYGGDALIEPVASQSQIMGSM
jgi:uncharacterized NAD-dependent epimerase/dehydratase family protein